jgi:hypothetical protein
MKEAEDLLNENYKLQKREIKEDIKDETISHTSELVDSIVKTAMYMFNTIPTKIIMTLFTDMEK